MGIKEDFTAFVANANDATNNIKKSLDAIAAILSAADPDTPADIAAARDAAVAALKAVSDQAGSIAAGNQPVVPPTPVITPVL